MKAYRIYHIYNGHKYYSCYTHGMGQHFCQNGYDCIPFIDIQKANGFKDFEEKHVAPIDEKRHIEEYEECRDLSINKNGHIIATEWVPNYEKFLYTEMRGVA